MEENIPESIHEKDKEIVEEMQKLLDVESAALCFIAPYLPEKVSPSRVITASINVIEELMVENAIRVLKEANIKKLLLLVNSPGGGVSSSYKIAYALRDNFKDITVFVPHIAASGATLISLACNKLIMGDMSNLTPIDVQIVRNGNSCSVNAMIRSFRNLGTLLKTQHESDIGYPVKALADKLDPVELQEWMDKSELMETHTKEIMYHDWSPFKDNANQIIEWLTRGLPTHSYSIMYKNAKEQLGENVVFHGEEPEFVEHWSAMRKWFRKYVLKESAHHIITYILPNKTKNLKTRVNKKR